MTANDNTANDNTTDRFPLDELSRRVAQRLAAAPLRQTNGQVAAVPDARTLRYYTTLGLLDRPLEVRGRRAFYGERHVLQTLAVKALQAEGHALAEIQRQLNGLTDDDLRAIAARPDANRFWPATPAPAAPREAPAAHPDSAVAPHPAALRLAPGLVLVLDTARPLDAADIAALVSAATELTEEVRLRSLEPPAPAPPKETS